MSAAREAGETPRHRVPIGEWVAVRAPATLTVHGLGSCVAVFLRDPATGLAALAHVLLPEPSSRLPVLRPGRYAVLAVQAMTGALVEMGAAVSRIEAKIVGGAEMFAFSQPGVLPAVGARNVEAVRSALARLGIGLVAEDTGGDFGRTISADAATGEIRVRTVRRGSWKL